MDSNATHNTASGAPERPPFDEKKYASIRLIIFEEPSAPDDMAKAHWSLFILHWGGGTRRKVIHVLPSGDVAQPDYILQIRAEYDPTQSQRALMLDEPLSSIVDRCHIVDRHPETKEGRTINSPRAGLDKFEELALRIPPPTSKLLEPVTLPGWADNIRYKNCQTWIWEYVQLLCKERVLTDPADLTMIPIE